MCPFLHSGNSWVCIWCHDNDDALITAHGDPQVSAPIASRAHHTLPHGAPRPHTRPVQQKSTRLHENNASARQVGIRRLNRGREAGGGNTYVPLRGHGPQAVQLNDDIFSTRTQYAVRSGWHKITACIGIALPATVRAK